MPTTDPVQALCEHVVALVNADSELRTLMGRSAVLIVPWSSFVVDGPLPMIAYDTLSGPDAVSSRAQRVVMAFATYGASKAVCNTICARLGVLLRYPAFASRGADIAQDPATRPTRSWPPAEPRQDDAAQYRADIDLAFLVPG